LTALTRFQLPPILDILSGIVSGLKNAGAADITLAERSAMGETGDVLAEMGVFRLSDKLGFNTIVLDELNEEGWIHFKPHGHSH
jgi:uncharacterized protein (DUF362 family)